MDYPKFLPAHINYNFKELNTFDETTDKLIKAYDYHLWLETPSSDIKYGDLKYLPMHKHDFYEINIMTKGEAIHYINDMIHPATPGCVFVIPPAVQHGYYAISPTEIFHILLSNEFIAKNTQFLLNLKGYSFLFNIEPLLRQHGNNFFLPLNEADLSYIQILLNRLLSYDNDKGENTSSLRQTLVLNIISEFCTISAKNMADKGEVSTAFNLVKIIEYINSHFDEKINFHELAKHHNMSYASFLRTFKKICGTTPARYLSEYRISEAINIMKNKRLSLTEIAYQCGFYDSSHFTNTFLAITGEKPTEFLRNHLDNH